MLKERRLKNKSHSLDLTDVSGSDLQFVPDVVQNNWALLLCVQFDSLDWKRIRTWRRVCFIFPSCSSDGLFASGSHAGELILWDAVDWNILAYEHILWEESQACAQAEIRLAAPKPSEMSIQHLTTNGKVRRTSVTRGEWFLRCSDVDPWCVCVVKLILAAVGSGLYVYSVLSKMVVAYRKVAHDSNVLHTMLLSDRWDITHFLLLTSTRCDRDYLPQRIRFVFGWIFYLPVCFCERTVWPLTPSDTMISSYSPPVLSCTSGPAVTLQPKTDWIPFIRIHLSFTQTLNKFVVCFSLLIVLIPLRFGTCNKRELHLSSTRGRHRSSSSSSSLETKNKSPDHSEDKIKSQFDSYVFLIK